MTQPGTDIQLSQDTVDLFMKMAGALEPFDAGGSDAILQQIMNATTLDDYNAIFEGDRAFPLGVEVKVTKARYAKSEYAQGAPFYLVIDGERLDTHTVGQWTLGAGVPLAMICRAAFNDQLPLIGKAYEADTPTKSGYKPINWKMIALGSPTKAAKGA